MQYLMLIETSFFYSVRQNGEWNNLDEKYHEFIEKVIDLCHDKQNHSMVVFTLLYTEIELSELIQEDLVCKESQRYVKRAIVFIHKALDLIELYQQRELSGQWMGPVNEGRNLQNRCIWTGNNIELVEFVYGLVEMKSIDYGDLSIQELIRCISGFFQVEIKDCYGAYVDMKRRKNNSRTYYLDKMRERLNLRMERDDEQEYGNR